MHWKRWLLIVLSLLTLFCFSGCGGSVDLDPDFYTEYTEEEHLQKISERTEERFAAELESGEIVDYTVETVYAFNTEDPRFFLVQVEYAEEWEVGYFEKENEEIVKKTYMTKYKYIVGFIDNEKYWRGLAGVGSDFIEGRNPYEVLGFKENKKYYGDWGIFAVKTKLGVLQIYKAANEDNSEVRIKESQGTQQSLVGIFKGLSYLHGTKFIAHSHGLY